jgi:hypothetical protein
MCLFLPVTTRMQALPKILHWIEVDDSEKHRPTILKYLLQLYICLKILIVVTIKMNILQKKNLQITHYNFTENTKKSFIKNAKMGGGALI